MTDQELVLVLLSAVAFLVLEFIALAYGLAARRTVLGKVATGISALLLGLSSIVLAAALTICLDNWNAGWLTGAPFWALLAVFLLVISLGLCGLFRTRWLS
jgi:hypothetical protein